MSEGVDRVENNLIVAFGRQSREGLCQGTELSLRSINRTTMNDSKSVSALHKEKLTVVCLLFNTANRIPITI
jgi:hypothetical protein